MKNVVRKNYNFKLFNKSYYNSGEYDDYLTRFASEGQVYANRIEMLIHPKKKWRFLDAGCGMGGLILALRKRGYQAYGTEISPYALKYSPAKEWITKADIQMLPYKNKHFDIVSSIDVLCYVNSHDLKATIKELCRIAKRYVVIETIDKDSQNASQEENPDELRFEDCLHTAELIKNELLRNSFVFEKKFLPATYTLDFNGIFRREN